MSFSSDGRGDMEPRKPKIVRSWDEMPPVVFDGDEAFSTRLLERRYRKMEEFCRLVSTLNVLLGTGLVAKAREALE